MKREQSTWRIWGGRRRPGMILLAGVITFACFCLFGCNRQKAAEVSAKTQAEDAASRDLRAIGAKVANAVLAKDTDTLLQFDHDPEDEASLKSKTGDAYCYLFDSTCMAEPRGRSIYEILSVGPNLGIDASVAKYEVKGKAYGLLMFYDKSKISSQDLYSPDFLCSDKGRRETAAWHFVLSNGRWTTTSLFDYKTERICKK